MAERITRRYIDKATGGPITGALIRLVSVTTPGNNPYYMEEIVSTDPNKQGYYFATLGVGAGSPAVVPRGVYRVERDFLDGNGYVPWEGEESVSPGRVTSMDPATEPLADRLATTQVRAIAFATDAQSTATGVLPVVQDAIDAAAIVAQSKRVIVGASGAVGQFSTWLGDYVTAPDGTDIDLAGARLQSWSNPNVSVVSCTGDITIRNGFLKILSSDGLGRVVTMQDPTKRAVFIGVTFERIGTAAPTVAGTTNQDCPAIFIGCKNVVLAPAAAGSSTRLQHAIGCTGVYEVGGAPVVQLDQANVNGTELGDLIRTALKTAVVEPDPGLPFTDMKEFAEAVKQMWATEIPALKTNGQDLQDQIDAGTAGGASWSWSRSNVLDGIFAITATLGAISGATCVYSTQNASVRGTGENAKLTLQCNAMFDFVASGAGGTPKIGGWLVIDLTEFEAALATKYPSWGPSGISGLRYSENGRCFGLYFKGAYRNVSLKTWLSNTTNRPPWVNLAAAQPLSGDGNGYVQFAAATEPWRSGGKAVKILIDTQNYAAGTYRAMCSFELEIPASQLGVQAGSGSLGTVVDLPYLM